MPALVLISCSPAPTLGRWQSSWKFALTAPSHQRAQGAHSRINHARSLPRLALPLAALQKKRPGTPVKPQQRWPASAASSGAAKRKAAAAAAEDSDDEDDFKAQQQAKRKKQAAAAKKAQAKKAAEGRRCRIVGACCRHAQRPRGPLRGAAVAVCREGWRACMLQPACPAHTHAACSLHQLPPPNPLPCPQRRTRMTPSGQTRRSLRQRRQRCRRAASRGQRGTRPSQTAAWTAPATLVRGRGERLAGRWRPW